MNLQEALGATDLEMRVIAMVRSAAGEREQRSCQGAAPFDLMRNVELRHARALIEAVRVGLDAEHAAEVERCRRLPRPEVERAEGGRKVWTCPACGHPNDAWRLACEADRCLYLRT